MGGRLGPRRRAEELGERVRAAQSRGLWPGERRTLREGFLVVVVEAEGAVKEEEGGGPKVLGCGGAVGRGGGGARREEAAEGGGRSGAERFDGRGGGGMEPKVGGVSRGGDGVIDPLVGGGTGTWPFICGAFFGRDSPLGLAFGVVGEVSACSEGEALRIGTVVVGIEMLDTTFLSGVGSLFLNLLASGLSVTPDEVSLDFEGALIPDASDLSHEVAYLCARKATAMNAAAPAASQTIAERKCHGYNSRRQRYLAGSHGGTVDSFPQALSLEPENRVIMGLSRNELS